MLVPDRAPTAHSSCRPLVRQFKWTFQASNVGICFVRATHSIYIKSEFHPKVKSCEQKYTLGRVVPLSVSQHAHLREQDSVNAFCVVSPVVFSDLCENLSGILSLLRFFAGSHVPDISPWPMRTWLFLRDTSAERDLMCDGIHAAELSACNTSMPFMWNPTGLLVIFIPCLSGKGTIGSFDASRRAVCQRQHTWRTWGQEVDDYYKTG